MAPRRGFFSLLILLSVFLSPASAFAATPSPVRGHAWSDEAGYLNFDRVRVGDEALSGYAWSANFGWIALAPSEGGVSHDGAGNLWGFAWGAQLGWIDFWGVSIDQTTGKFFGTAVGALSGTITFDCKDFCDVETDWRSPAPARRRQGSASRETPLSAPASPEFSTPEAADPARETEILAADLDRDGAIGVFDLNALMVHWGEAGEDNLADMDHNGVVDVFDFNLLMVLWGATFPL